MKKHLIQKLAAILFLVAMAILPARAQAQAEDCWFNYGTMSSDFGGYISAGLPWFSKNYATNANPAYFSNYVTTGNSLVPPGYYPGWCVDEHDDIDQHLASGVYYRVYEADFFATCDPLLNAKLTNEMTLHDIPILFDSSVFVPPSSWKMVNYILNHKTNNYFWDIQIAIWSLVGGPVLSYNLALPYPPHHQPAIDALLSAATNNAANWHPKFGDVLGVVTMVEHYTNVAAPKIFTNQQLMIIEVPIAPITSVGITKQVACLLPGNSCGTFSHLAAGYRGLEDPGFCYQIVITNSGNTVLTNFAVHDNMVGDITTNFFPTATSSLAPGTAITNFFKMSWDVNTTNTVQVSATGYTNTVSATDSAVALVDNASITCNVKVSSPSDVDGVPDNNNVTLPGCGPAAMVTFKITVCNPSAVNLTAVTITAPSLTNLDCALPAPFDLPAGTCITYQCSAMLACPGSPLTTPVSILARVLPDSSHCGYDLSSTNAVMVNSTCSATVQCSPATASIAGTVFAACSSTNMSIVPPNSALTNVTVQLLLANSNFVTSATTDVNGAYVFTNLSLGSYIVSVVPPTNTAPTGDLDAVLDSQTLVNIVACNGVNGVNFAYGNTNPPVIVTVPTGSNLGNNPANLPTDASVQALVVATSSSGNPTISVTHVDSTNGVTVTRTFTVTVTDACGNAAAPATVVYTWVNDNNPPTLIVPPLGGDLGCNPAAGSMPTDASVKSQLTASDDSGSATITVTHVDSGSDCAMVRTFTMTAADATGNVSAPRTAVYTWKVDHTAPVLNGLPAATAAYQCAGDVPQTATVTATDNCDGSVAVSHSVTVNGPACDLVITHTWTATDSCGNVATFQQVITVKDTTAPTLVTVPTGSNLGCNPATLPTDATVKSLVSATDNCGAAIVTVSHADVNNGCSVTRTFTITAADSCNNVSAPATVSYTWKVDTTAPVMSGLPASTASYQCLTDVPAAPTVTAMDDCDGALVPTFNETQSGTACNLTITRTWTVSDACGNTATFVQTITVADTTAPTIVCPPTMSVTNLSPLPAVTGSPTVTDNCDSNPSVTYNDVVTAGACAGSFVITRTWTAVDACNNTNTCVQVLNYYGNTSSLFGTVLAHCSLSDTNMSGDAGLNAVLVTLTDANSNALQTFTTDATGYFAFTNLAPGSYTVVVTPTTGYIPSFDVDGTLDSQTAVTMVGCDSVTNLVFGYRDNVAPVVSSYPSGSNLGANPASLPTDASIKALVLVTDNSGTPLVTVTHVDSTNGVNVTRTFTIAVSDTCGNDLANVTVVFNWVDDHTPPTLVLPPLGGDLGCNPADATLPTDDILKTQITATDNSGSATVTVTHVDSGNDCGKVRTFTVTASDASGNVSAPRQIVYTWKNDTTAPVLSGLPPSTATYQLLSDVPAAATVTAMDNCDGGVLVTFKETQSGATCNLTITRTWTAKDSCNNTASFTQTINIADTTAPVIKTVPTGSDLGCNPANPPSDATVKAGAVATDNSGSVTVSVTHVDSLSVVTMTRTFTITATDACNNAAAPVVVVYT